MSIEADDENKHISDDRLVEIAKSASREFSEEERMHIANCDRCKRLFGALSRLQEGDEQLFLRRGGLTADSPLFRHRERS